MTARRRPRRSSSSGPRRLVYAVTSRTPSEIVADRADGNAETMGLTTWPNDTIRKQDVVVSKTYLARPEIRELNRLTTILLDIFEDQLEMGRLVVMEDASTLLDRQLRDLGRAVLSTGGRVSAAEAKRLAEAEYATFAERRKRERHRSADEEIAELTRLARDLPRKPRK
nr:RhuM family protein [Aurantimonas sp. 22II-16-19i]